MVAEGFGINFIFLVSDISSNPELKWLTTL